MRSPEGGSALGDIGLELLDSDPDVNWEFLDADPLELTAELIRDYDALLVGDSNTQVTRRTLASVERLAVIARLGVGYDQIDEGACTEKDILLTITPDGVRRPMAVALLTLVLALAHKVLIKDRLTRAGRWGEKDHYRGMGVTGRTVGLIGFGNIAREFVHVSRALDLRYLAYDPFVRPTDEERATVEFVDLTALLSTSDFVCVTCPLTKETYHLLDADRLALLRSDAYLVNIARGPIVDLVALTRLLAERGIAGAAIDVFESEPVDPMDPLLQLENIIVTPHAIGHTDAIFLGNGRSACRSILEVAAGRIPKYVVNRSVVERAGLQAKLEGYGRGV
jgi:D-3-phosphoglycerate dehydrogenase